FGGQRLQHGWRFDEPWAVIERQYYFMIAQEIELLEMLEAETGTAGGVDFNRACDAKRIGIGAGGLGQRRRRRIGCRGRSCRSLGSGGRGGSDLGRGRLRSRGGLG